MAVIDEKKLYEYYEEYVSAENQILRDRVFQKIIKVISSYVDNVSNKYLQKYPEETFEDIKQWVLVGVFRGIEKRKEGKSLKSSIMWGIQHIMVKECKMYLRAKKRNIFDDNKYEENIGECKLKYIHDYEYGYNSNELGSEYYEDKWAAKIDIDICVEKLPGEYKEIFLLRQEGYSIIEISKLYKQSRAWLNKKWDRIRFYFKSYLNESYLYSN